MTRVSVGLTDTEWRVRCEQLAKEELELAVKEDEMKAEADEWKDRKKDLETGIAAIRSIIQRLAKEVDTRKAWTESQQELDMGSTEVRPDREPGEPGEEG
jgi:predicted nuclease with TOPRIM domain